MNNRRKEWTPAEVEETGLEQVWRWGRYGIPVFMAEHGILIRCPRGDVKNLVGYTPPNYCSRLICV